MSCAWNHSDVCTPIQRAFRYFSGLLHVVRLTGMTDNGQREAKRCGEGEIEDHREAMIQICSTNMAI